MPQVKPWMLMAVVILMAVVWWKQHEADLKKQGALQEALRGLEARNAKLEDEAGRIDTVYRTDTVRLSHTYVRTDSILRVDTVFSRDRVTQIVQAERDACSAVISTCERAKANLLAQLANRDSVITAIKAERPSWLSRTSGKLGWLGAGIIAGFVLNK